MGTPPPDPVAHPGTCPICAQPVPIEARERPFCSERCRWVDLGRWLDGSYRVTAPAPLGEEPEA